MTKLRTIGTRGSRRDRSCSIRRSLSDEGSSTNATSFGEGFTNARAPAGRPPARAPPPTCELLHQRGETQTLDHEPNHIDIFESSRRHRDGTYQEDRVFSQVECMGQLVTESSEGSSTSQTSVDSAMDVVLRAPTHDRVFCTGSGVMPTSYFGREGMRLRARQTHGSEISQLRQELDQAREAREALERTMQEEHEAFKRTMRTMHEEQEAFKRTMRTMQEEREAFKCTMQEEREAFKRTMQEEREALERMMREERLAREALKRQMQELVRRFGDGSSRGS